MNYLTYLPVFDNLTKPQQASLTNSAFVRKFNKNEILHNGSQDCTGLILVLSGQLRAFTISDGGREITMYRLFERDICLFFRFMYNEQHPVRHNCHSGKGYRSFSDPVGNL